jgi:hypothetical protein
MSESVSVSACAGVLYIPPYSPSSYCLYTFIYTYLFIIYLRLFLFNYGLYTEALGSTQPSILGVKPQGREADHSPPTSTEVKKTWIHTSAPPYVFMA